MRPRVEYRLIALVSGMEGIAAVENKLNAHAGEGWRLLPVTVSGSWGIMEREVPEDPKCPQCGQTMARFAGPEKANGWLCPCCEVPNA